MLQPTARFVMVKLLKSQDRKNQTNINAPLQ
jgi:hypothetical protein